MSRFLPIAALALLACSAARAHTDQTSNLALTGPPPVQAAPEFHAAGAIAALTLLLCGVAVLKGRRRD
jgi:hypothetical protein